MRHLWQWFLGYIKVLLKGKQVNRFFNLCSRNGIHLWNISRDIEHQFMVHISLRDFYHIKPFLKKTKTKLRIVAKKGFPFWCHYHPRLKWMFVLCFFVLCIMIYSHTFVWTIEINGNSKISTQEMLNLLAEQEIEVGNKCDEINCTQIEYLIRQNYQQIGWVSVYMEHTKLCIEVKESLYDPYNAFEIDKNCQYNLVANKDAVISSIVTRSGTALVTKGTHVKKGDILVLGQCEIFDDAGVVKDTLKLYADALIYGDVVYDFQIELSEMEIVSLKISDLYSNQQLFFLANQKLSQFFDKLEKNGVIILDKNVMIEKEEKNIVFYVHLKTREQIGINIPVEEMWEYEFE